MLLRTYLTSTPVLEGTRLRFAVSVTDEMFMPLPGDFSLDLSLRDSKGTRLAGIRDVQVSSFRICDGLELVIDCAVPESVVGQDACLLVAAKTETDSEAGTGSRARSRSPARSKCRVQTSASCNDRALPEAQRLGDIWAVHAEALHGDAVLSCEYPLSSREDEHYFRCFTLGSHVLRIREEISSAEMPTGGHLWDAGVVLAHWLTTMGPNAAELRGKAVLELGSGCGLPGIVAAHLFASRTVFTDRQPVLQLVKQNVATNCPNQNTRVLELDWVKKEHWHQVKSQCGDAFDIILMSDLLYTSTAASKVKDTLLFFSKPGTLIFLAHKPRMESPGSPSEPCNPLALESTLGPWFESTRILSVGREHCPIHLFRMSRWKS